MLSNFLYLKKGLKVVIDLLNCIKQYYYYYYGKNETALLQL